MIERAPYSRFSGRVPVIDLFAGPGGLSEGFSACETAGRRVFRIALSIEKDPLAHKTLLLRSFFRQFEPGAVPEDYYARLRGEFGEFADEVLFSRHPVEAERARSASWCVELGNPRPGREEVDRRIEAALDGAKAWVLIGGPPCQAYSIVGRSRRASEARSTFEGDPRNFLYREYLRILGRFSPPVFLMENVKGLLSAQIGGKSIFDKILTDLKHEGYDLHPLVSRGGRTLFDAKDLRPSAFVVRSEEFGIPQARHRVILLGVRTGCPEVPDVLKKIATTVRVRDVLRDLPPIRSRLSSGPDVPAEWAESIRDGLRDVSSRDRVGRRMAKTARRLRVGAKTGAEFVPAEVGPRVLRGWFHDPRLKGVCNHASRTHREDDLVRYFFAACYARLEGRSPNLHDFPEAFLPEHENVIRPDKDRYYFADRFRVQVADKPATTVTCHLAKDGNSFIHPDPTQCRSLTVREAARLQTFPDNYFFCGPRTSQFQQVGNAVPPLLARKFADIVHGLLCRWMPDEVMGREHGQQERAPKLQNVADPA